MRKGGALVVNELTTAQRSPEPVAPVNIVVTPRRRHPVRKALLGLLACTLFLALAAVAGVFYLQNRLDSQIQRIDNVFTGLDNRPAKPTTGTAASSLNILVMGTDRRAEGSATGLDGTGEEWIPGAQRTDAIMILHIDGDREGASLISIPRDSWVDVPGYGTNKINAAFSFSGPSLAIETVEQYTGVRIDHLAVIDMIGFEALTDTLGGVDIKVPQTVEDTARNVVWAKGEHHLDGEEALLYVRQRYGLPRGDFDRVQRQQAFVRSLMRSTLQSLRNDGPRTAYDVLDTLSRHVSVDSGWSVGDLRSLAFDLRGMSTGDVDFMTVPVLGTGMEGDQSVVYLDASANRSLWEAVRNDRVTRWLSMHATDVVTGPVR